MAANIIAIDDSKFDRFIIQRILENKLINVSVTVYSSAQEVLDQLRDGICQPDIVLLDINMPEKNGWEFLEEFKEYQLDIPVYILTSSDSASDKNKAAENKLVKGFLNKPLTVQSIGRIATNENLVLA